MLYIQLGVIDQQKRETGNTHTGFGRGWHNVKLTEVVSGDTASLHLPFLSSLSSLCFVFLCALSILKMQEIMSLILLSVDETSVVLSLKENI